MEEPRPPLHLKRSKNFAALLPPAIERHALAGPRFYVTPNQRFSPGVVLLSIVLAVGALFGVGEGLRHARRRHSSAYDSGAIQFGRSTFGGPSSDDDDDDPSRVDTIYLGDPADAPVPSRAGTHASSVHPFVVVRLPRTGDQVGQIPDTPAGRLLYAWLAAFNKPDYPALGNVLPGTKDSSAGAAQVDLRNQTGGFTLVSAKEVQPGVLVFRLHDQSTTATEALGTLQVRPNSSPAQIGSFSLRAISPPVAH